MPKFQIKYKSSFINWAYTQDFKVEEYNSSKLENIPYWTNYPTPCLDFWAFF